MPVSTSPSSLASCFSSAFSVCHGTIILGDGLQGDMGSNFLFLNNSAGNRGEGGRERKKPKPQKRMKTFLNSISKMRRLKSPSHTTQPSSHSIQSPPYRAGQQREDTSWKQGVCDLCHGIASTIEMSLPESLNVVAWAGDRVCGQQQGPEKTPYPSKDSSAT